MNMHHGDCPMTNRRPAARTGCTCDAIEMAFYGETFPDDRDVPEGLDT